MLLWLQRCYRDLPRKYWELGDWLYRNLPDRFGEKYGWWEKEDGGEWGDWLDP